MLNRVILQGNTGRSPKLCLTQEGKEILTFSVATVQSWKDETGEWASATDWHHIVVFRASTIKWLKKDLKRGDPVYVEGKLTYHSWIDKYGQRRFTPHVVIAGRDGRVVPLTSALKPFPSSILNANPTIQDKPNSVSLEEEGDPECSEQEEWSDDLPLSQEKAKPTLH